MADAPGLLVPVSLEALVVNQSDLHNTTWSNSTRAYTGAGKYEPLEPPPFVRGNDRPRLGVTLHWALPDALTRGRRDRDGKLVFPLVPDRWLVVRSSPGKPLKAWVVESDYLDPAKGSNLYPDGTPQRGWTRIGRARELKDWTRPRDHAPFLTALGPGDQPAYSADVANLDNVLSFHDPLTDPELGIYSEEGDGMDEAAVLSYQVIGWFASPALSDPLLNHSRLGEGLLRGWRERRAGRQLSAEDIEASSWLTADEWKDLMTALGWSTGDELDLQQAVGDGADPRAVYPSRTLCHGMVYGVNWTGRFKGAAQPYFRGDRSAFAETPIGSRSARRSKGSAKGWQNDEFTDLAGPTRQDFPHIAIGNSTIDALAALAAHLLDTDENTEHIATLFQALQYDLLHNYDQPGGQIELRQRIHQEWFAASAGGSSWEVVAPRRNEPVEGEDEPSAMDVAQRLEVLDADKLLDQLNEKQRALDAQQHKLASARRTLYELWWKSERRKGLSPKPELPPDTNLAELLKQAASEVDASLEALTKPRGLVAQRNTARDRLTARGIHYVPPGTKPAEDANTLQLHERPGPRFFRPADPVVLVYGGKRSTRHGADGRWSEDGTLFCRFADQTLSALATTGGSRVADAESLKTQFDFDALSTDKLPPSVVDLMVESLLLDPVQARQIAALVPDSAEKVRRRQQIIWGDHREQNVTVAAMTYAAGFRGVRPSPQAVTAWAQPWSPLYLCWRVTWYPSDANPGAAVSENWNFNGLDYDWAGLSGFNHSKAVTLQGRSLLTSTSTRAIQDSLSGLFDLKTGDDGEPAVDKAALEKLRTRLADADLLSQALSGFHDQLIQRDRSQAYDPPGPARKRLGDIERLAPAPFRNGATGEAGHFYPLRAGHFRLQRLWIVDSFGQVFDPIKERGQSPASFTPLRGSGMVTTGLAQRQDTQMLQLPPRIVQASRLQFRFSRPHSDEPDSEKAPVCGWLLPNHFDKSLVVYAPDGAALGAVLRVSEGIRWQPVAGGEQRTADAINDQDMRTLIDELLGRGKAAFEDLLEAIDRTLWTTDPLGKRGSNLSTLIGRPIAVVRATLRLELAGDPVHDQLWEHTGQNKTHGFENVELPVQLGHADLGDDGTIGFFGERAENAGNIDYAKFHAVQPRIDLNEGTNGYVVLPRDELWPRVAANGKTVHLTLLVDPRGSVHARSGLVPVKAIRLPRHYIERPLERMDVTFRVGPILNKPEGMRMPIPAEIQQGWSWIQQTGVNVWAGDEKIEPVTHHARLEDTPLHIREGWLKLSDALGEGGDDDD